MPKQSEATVTIPAHELRPNVAAVWPKIYQQVAAKVCYLIDAQGIKPDNISIEVRQQDWEFVLEMWASCYLATPQVTRVTFMARLIGAVARLVRVNLSPVHSNRFITIDERYMRQFYETMRDHQCLWLVGRKYHVKLISSSYSA